MAVLRWLLSATIVPSHSAADLMRDKRSAVLSRLRGACQGGADHAAGIAFAARQIAAQHQPQVDPAVWRRLGRLYRFAAETLGQALGCFGKAGLVLDPGTLDSKTFLVRQPNYLGVLVRDGAGQGARHAGDAIAVADFHPRGRFDDVLIGLGGERWRRRLGAGHRR